MQPQCELDPHWCPIPRGQNSFIQQWRNSTTGGRALGTRALQKCLPGYKRAYGDALLACGTNVVGTAGMWFSDEFGNAATDLYCVIDQEYCPPINEFAEGTKTERYDGRYMGAVFKRRCAPGYLDAYGDAEVFCGNDGSWKVGIRNAYLSECVFIEEYCPLPNMTHALGGFGVASSGFLLPRLAGGLWGLCW